MAARPAEQDDPRFQPRDDPTAKVFDTPPSTAVKDDFLAWVRKTGKPDEWRWHVHTKPPADSHPRIEEKFGIPESLRSAVGMAPCPICSIRGPRYFEGMLAYFAEEKCLRAIGHECGHQFFEEGVFASAVEDFKSKRSNEAAQNFLLDNLSKVPRARVVIQQLTPLARRVDDLARGIRSALGTRLAKNIFRRSDGGTLPLYVERPVQTFDRAGNAFTRNESHFETAFRVEGLSTLRGHGPTAEAVLQRADRVLELMAFADDDKIVEAMLEWGVEGRAEAVVRMRDAWVLIRDAIAIIDDRRSFLDRANLARLVEWSMHPNCPLHFYIELDQAGQVRIGTNYHHARNIPIGLPAELPATLESLT